MHSILLIQPFAHEDHDGEGQPDHDGGEYGNLLLKCCEAAMDFVEANENEDAKNAQKHSDELRDICEQRRERRG
jgi:hypothetical protein